jgi:hypothetical protein
MIWICSLQEKYGRLTPCKGVWFIHFKWFQSTTVWIANQPCLIFKLPFFEVSWNISNRIILRFGHFATYNISWKLLFVLKKLIKSFMFLIIIAMLIDNIMNYLECSKWLINWVAKYVFSCLHGNYNYIFLFISARYWHTW